MSIMFSKQDLTGPVFVLKDFIKCGNNFSCKVVEQTSSLNTEIKLAILKKAAILKTNATKKRVEENGSYRVTPIKKK